MFTSFELLKQSQINFMTEGTKKLLEEKLVRLKEEEAQHRLEIGEAAGSESNWHDNVAFEEANRLVDITHIQVEELRQKLINVGIITSREDTTSVGLGNSVVVRYAGESEDEVYTILGADDVARKQPGWISYTSELGKNMMGKHAGETIQFTVEQAKQQFTREVRIVAILKGNF